MVKRVNFFLYILPHKKCGGLKPQLNIIFIDFVGRLVSWMVLD